MLSAVAASRGCTTAGSASWRRSSSVNSAKPNSPPWLTITPVRSDLNQLPVTGLAATATTAVFRIAMPSTIALTNGRLRSNSGTSSSMPSVMKNMPSSTSRYERMVASI